MRLAQKHKLADSFFHLWWTAIRMMWFYLNLEALKPEHGSEYPMIQSSGQME